VLTPLRPCQVQKELAKPLQGVEGDAATEQGDIVLGNWEDPELLQGKKYEVVLADYLIGAMDGFSPFKQDLIFERLKQHMAPGGVLYIIGLEPIVSHPPRLFYFLVAGLGSSWFTPTYTHCSHARTLHALPRPVTHVFPRTALPSTTAVLGRE